MNQDFVSKTISPADAPLGDAWGEDDSSQLNEGSSADCCPVDIGRMIAANTDCC
jgi:hypothetical protein